MPNDPPNLDEIVQHESGHAVARWALHSPFQRIAIDGVPVPQVVPLPNSSVGVGQHVLIAACGMIADYQRRNLMITDGNIAKLLLPGHANGRRAGRHDGPAGCLLPGRHLAAGRHLGIS
jgi:hypothetical protein